MDYISLIQIFGIIVVNSCLVFILIRLHDGYKRRPTNNSFSTYQDPIKIKIFAADFAFLPSEILTLPDTSYSDLWVKVTEGYYSTESVVKAYHHRLLSAIRAGCCVEPLRVKENIHATSIGKLWGIPLAIEEIPPGKCENSDLFRALEICGAMPVAKTYASRNDTLCNPVNSSRVTGSSSADQVTLIKNGGAVVGFATDFVGDLLITTAFCGVTLLRPSKARLPHLEEIQRLYSTICPISRSVDVLIATLEDLGPLDGINSNKIRVGYFSTFPGNKVPKPVPSVERALRDAITSLSVMGNSVEEILPPDPNDFLPLIINDAISLGNEPCDAWVNALVHFSSIPSFLKPFIPSWLLVRLLSLFNKSQICQNPAAVRGFSEVLRSSWWGCENPYDVVICPILPYPALPRNEDHASYDFRPSPYVSLFGFTNHPAGVVPVTTVTLNDTRLALKEAEAFRKMGDQMNARVHAAQRGATGLPVSLQVVGLPNSDETVLQVMRKLEVLTVA